MGKGALRVRHYGHKSSYWLVVLGTMWFCLSAMSCHCTNEDSLMIATAANVQYAMQEIVDLYETKTGEACHLILGSSGKLTAQIREGAPYDLFISADMNYPEELHRSGYTTAAPEIYAYGNLVLWTMKENITPNIESLSNQNIEHIALANPKLAPYGLAAEQVLTQSGIDKVVADKLVFGESISQTNQFVISQAADLGFTAKSVVVSPKMKNKGKWIEIDNSTYEPISQGAVILKRKQGKIAQAENFYHFLFTEEVQTILIKYGYSVKKTK